MNVLIDKATNQLIGQCGLLIQTIKDTERLEIGYAILPQFWGKGYASEVAAKCKNYAFENNLTDSLISQVHVDTIASEKVALKNGMTLEKTMKSFHILVFIHTSYVWHNQKFKKYHLTIYFFLKITVNLNLLFVYLCKMKNIFIILFLFTLAACSSAPTESEETETMEDTTSLQDILNDKKEGFNAEADSAKKRVYAEGIQAVIDAKIATNALQVGDKAPNFTLTNATGKKITLYKELKKGPVILMWYRGGWCPYCNLTLNAMQDMLPQFLAGGAQLLALTPESADKSISTAEKNELAFEVLSDMDNTIGKEYGVVFQLTDEVKAYYENGFGLSGYNGNDKGELPLGATYVIGTDGIVTYAFLDADYRNRAEPIAVLDALTNTK